MTKYISAAEGNKRLRAELERLWPKTKFYVRLTPGHSTNVAWVDGPTEAEVKQVSDHFEGQSFDGMIDLASSVYHTDPKTGEQVHYGINYINEERCYSVAFLREIAEKVAAEYGKPVPAIKTRPHYYSRDGKIENTAYVVDGDERIADGYYKLRELIYREAQKTSAVTPSNRTASAATATKVEGGWQVRGTQFRDGDIFRQYKESLDFRWNKDNPKDRFWWCPVETLPADVLALLDGQHPTKVTAPTSPAQKFRDWADAMQKTIDGKFNSATSRQNPTRRRRGIIESMEQDGRKLQQVQAALRKLADDWDNNTIPDILKGLTTKTQVERVATSPYFPSLQHEKTVYAAMVKAGIGTPQRYNEARAALTTTLQPPTSSIEDQIRKAKRELVGTKIEGFIPTPEPVVEQMLRLADIRDNARVLEPSAGWGNIADAVRQRHPDITVDCIELVSSLRRILELKGHNLVSHDALSYTTADLYDTILMNPPFENNQDIQHVRYCYEHLLKPGGRLVAIMSEHPFFGREKQAQDFRDWLEQTGSSDPLPDGTFEKSEYRPTSVRTRLVVIDKPVPQISSYEQALAAYRKAVYSNDMNVLKQAAATLRELTIQAK